VAKVFSDIATKTIQAVVDEDQLSLAIGRNGQNVRLASELIGWKIDLYSSREWLERGGEGTLFGLLDGEEDDTPRVPLSQLEGLSPELVALLDQAGYGALNDVMDLEPEEIAGIPGMTQGAADELARFVAELTEEVPVEGEAEEPAVVAPAENESVKTETEPAGGEATAG
jgi:N utilization substance protein A